MKIVLIGVGVVAAVAVAGVGAWVYFVNNVEQPAYSVVAQDGPYEIRDYPELLVAEVRRSGDRRTAVNAGFRPLADFIFANDRAGDSIAMTAPVTQAREPIAMTAPVTQSPSDVGGEGEWTVRFIMPSEYTYESLPKPGGGDVRIETVPAARKAAIRFSGVATDDLLAEKEAELRAWLEDRQAEIAGPPTFAYYNDPFTPGFLRRNEVLFDLAG